MIFKKLKKAKSIRSILTHLRVLCFILLSVNHKSDYLREVWEFCYQRDMVASYIGPILHKILTKNSCFSDNSK